MIGIFVLCQSVLFVSADDNVLINIPIENSEEMVSRYIDYVYSSMGNFYSDYSSSSYYVNYSAGVKTAIVRTIWGDVEVPIETYLDSGLQLRANCYGYAFRFFYAPQDLNNVMGYNLKEGGRFGFYKQQPGEFAVKANGLTVNITETESVIVSNYYDLILRLDQVLGSSWYTNAQRMNVMQQLLQADASALGYTITEMTSMAIPNAQSYSNKRLIALVVANGDYHFYMQHSDNTWSHKGGTEQPSNKCFDCNIELNNTNIRSHACEGDYQDGMVKFFYITKDAVIDYGHGNGCFDTSTRTAIVLAERVGNEVFSAEFIETVPEDYLTGYIDYVGDVDFYNFYVLESDDFNFTVEAEGGYDIGIVIYNSSGDTVATAVTYSGIATFSVFLSSSDDYYIGFYALDQNIYAYKTVSYTWYQ